MKHDSSATSIISLIVAAISLVLGVLNWRLAGVQHFGVYLAMFGLAISLILIPSIHFYFEKTTRLERSIKAIIQGADIESILDKQKLIKRLVSKAMTIEVYGANDLFKIIQTTTKTSIDRKTKLRLFSFRRPPEAARSWRAERIVSPYPFPVQAIFFFSSSEIVSTALLIPTVDDYMERGWVLLSYVKLVNRLRSCYHELYSDISVCLDTSSSEKLSCQAIEHLLSEFREQWREFPLRHRRVCRFGKEVTSLQQEITSQATAVDALDMSDLAIWMPGGRAYKVAEENRAVVQSGGTVRRIFLVDSEEERRLHAGMLGPLQAVLKLQQSFGITVGLIYKDAMKPTDVRDIAIYTTNSGRIIWIETIKGQGTIEGSEGYFSACRSEIEGAQQLLDRLWRDLDPGKKAREILTIREI